MGESKRHHFVPQSILRRFSRPDKAGSIFFFDKQTDKVRPSSIADAGMENGFNTVVVDGERINFEDDFNEIDGAMAGVHSRIVEARSLAVLDDDGRAILADAAAVQLLRTKMLRSTMVSLTAAIMNDMARVGLIEGQPDPMDEQAARAMARQAVQERTRQRNILLGKELLLLEPDQGSVFWTSDNPIVRYNPLPYGDTGLSSPGVEIFWPIATDLAIGFMCRSYRETMAAGVALGARLEERARLRCETLTRAFVDGTPTLLGRTGGTAAFLNELQVRSSSRFVYASRDDFSLARRILEADAGLRKVESLATLGRIGEGPPRRGNMPPGLQLVVFGRQGHHMFPVAALADASGGFDVTLTEPIYAVILMGERPWKEVRLYDDGHEMRGMRSVEVTASATSAGPRLSVRSTVKLPGVDF